MPTLPDDYGNPLPPSPGPEGPASAGPQAPGPLSGLDPRAIHRLAQLWGLDDETAALMLQYRRSQALAGSPAPQGRQVGDVYVAANPLEMAASGMKEGLGMRGMKDAEARARAIGKQRVRGAEAAYGMYGSTPLTDPEDVDY